MKKNSYYFVNAITLYRLVTAPVLVFLIAWARYDIFRWMLAVSFFTDFVDGLIARHYRVTSILGSRLDAVADDLTIVAAMTGMFIFKREFLIQHTGIFVFLLALLILQMAVAIARYGRISSFHTYSAKGAAVMQAVFMLSLFFLTTAPLWLFYLAAIATIINIFEEIILVLMLHQWKSDVKGIYWIINRKEPQHT